MIRVHHLNNSRSQRVLWLLEELGLEYDVVRYQRHAKTMLAPPELRAVHPLGKSPVIEEDGHVLAESGAIVEHLVERHGPHLGARPARPIAPATCTGCTTRGLGHAAPAHAPDPRPHGPARPPARPYVDGQIRGHLDYMEGELARTGWFVGEAFSAADIQMSFPIEAAAARAGLDASRPNLMAFLERVQSRPAYRRALERGGPYAFAR
jgi:glutathione S-transferase